ncbi:hypothetical protein CVIRNUC_003502 [Coccomyxa viridis]|uniref:GIY-YIG domain-containing protein n=1 Tax=Coccomyxa viridis TaxID=1274662 RepID=A0AAV1I231_9CHLO|nr:hypothetical protein CVIRNUC_003502 [Coccomyxa viridis]
MASLDAYVDLILDTNEHVVGEIYLIRNNETGKSYIGQSLSHRLNRSRYRPFGHLGRFKDHISEALNNKKTKQCTYLNASIRHYGREAFSVELLERCRPTEMDAIERRLILERNTLAPGGYNLTAGGKGALYVKAPTENLATNFLAAEIAEGKTWRNAKKSEETRAKMREASARFQENRSEASKALLVKNVQEQHMRTKLDKFKDLDIDFEHPDWYLYDRTDKGKPYCRLLVGPIRKGGVFTKFYGDSVEDSRRRAKDFLAKLNDYKAATTASSYTADTVIASSSSST